MSCACDTRFDELTDYIKENLNSEHPQSSLIAVLHYAQESFGYLNKDIMEHIAQVSEVPAAEIYGVATFYGYFKHTPQGKHRISVCMGTACYIRGAAKLLEMIEDDLDVKVGGTTEDMQFTLDETRCVGACGLAPVLTVDERVYARVEPEQIKEILDEYRASAE